MCSTKSAPSPGRRQEVEDPAAVVVDQHDHELQSQPRRGEQPADVVRQGDVADQQHDRAARRRRRRRTPWRPSRRSRSRRGSTARGAASGRAGKNVSTSRIGIEEATTSVASSGSRDPSSAATRGSFSSGPERRGDRRRRRRGRRACQPSSHAGRALAAAARERLEHRARVGATIVPTAPAGSCHAVSGSKRDLQRVPSPASHARSGLDVGRSPTRSTSSGASAAPTRRRAAARRSARSRPARGARPTAARPAAAARPRSANAGERRRRAAGRARRGRRR